MDEWLLNSKEYIENNIFVLYEFKQHLNLLEIKPLARDIRDIWAKDIGQKPNFSSKMSFDAPLGIKITLEYIGSSRLNDRYLILTVDNLTLQLFDIIGMQRGLVDKLLIN